MSFFSVRFSTEQHRCTVLTKQVPQFERNEFDEADLLFETGILVFMKCDSFFFTLQGSYPHHAQNGPEAFLGLLSTPHGQPFRG